MFSFFGKNSSELGNVFIICGLGNPGANYKKTRHNAGFMVIDHFCNKFDLKLKRKWRSEYTEFEYEGMKLILLKPQTFMNNSGDAVKKFAKKYGVQPANVLVAYDEMSLKTGRLRIRNGGSAGGHNGIKSVLQNFGGADFLRLRIGIDHPGKGADVADYVLSDFTLSEMELISPAVSACADAVLMLSTEGCEAAMNAFNGTVPGGSSQPNQETKN